MSMINKMLDISSILIAVILIPSLVSAPVILSISSDTDIALQESYQDFAHALHRLRQEEKDLRMHRQLAMNGENYLTVTPCSLTLRMNWGTAVLKEYSLYPDRGDNVPGGIVYVSSKDPPLVCVIHLSNGVSIRDRADKDPHNTRCIYLENEDFQALFDFVDLGSKVIWEF